MKKEEALRMELISAALNAVSKACDRVNREKCPSAIAELITIVQVK
jgi:hypothetical protein